MRSLNLQWQVTIAIVVSLLVIDGIGTMMAEANFREVESHHASEDARKSVEALKQVMDYRFGNIGQRAREAATAAAYTDPEEILRDMARAGFSAAVVLGANDTVLGASGEAATNQTLREMMVARAPPVYYPAQVMRYGDGWLTVAARSTSVTTAVVGAMSQSYVEDSFLADILIDPADARLVVLKDGTVLAATHTWTNDTFDDEAIDRYDPAASTGLVAFLRALAAGPEERSPVAEIEGPFLVQSTPLVFLEGSVVHLVPGREIDARVEALTARFFILSSATYALVGTAVVLTVGFAMRPLRQITDAARRLGQGEEDLRLRVRGRDELGLLAQVLNHSAAEIAQARRRQEAHAEESRLSAEAFQLAVGDLARAVGEAETPAEIGRRLADAVLHVTQSRGAVVAHDGKPLSTAGTDEATPAAVEALLASVPEVFHHLRMGSGDEIVEVAVLPREGDRLGTADLRKVEILAAQAVFSFHRARQTASLREAHDALDRLVRHKQVYLDILSHDLKNPIAVARGRAEMLARKEAELAPRIKPIEDALDRATAIIDEAVLFAKLERDQALEKPSTDLIALCEEAATALRPLAAAKDLDVSVRAPAPVSWPANKLLGRAVENLLSNAIKWSPEGQRVEIVLDAQPTCVAISIVDHGPGIAPADRPRLFGRFERADRTGVKGTGLGLAIAKRVVDMHEGEIHIHDTPGGGATFRIELPLPQIPKTEPPRAPPAGVGGRA